MKANKFVKQCGPFKVVSYSQDGQGVRLVIYPAFPQYEENWAISRMKGKGGGPSIFTAMALATEMQEFLNQPYDEVAIAKWHQALDSVFGILKRKLKHDRRIQKK